MISEKLAAQLIVLGLSVLWSLLFYMGKRLFASMDKKMDASFSRMDEIGRELKEQFEKSDIRLEKDFERLELGTESQVKGLAEKMETQSKAQRSDIKKRLESATRAYSRLFVSRQEFGAFTANINHKIDSIYETLSREGINSK